MATMRKRVGVTRGLYKDKEINSGFPVRPVVLSVHTGVGPNVELQS
jgi:hypothetical protein